MSIVDCLVALKDVPFPGRLAHHDFACLLVAVWTKTQWGEA